MALKDWSTTAASNTTILAGITLDSSVMTGDQVDDAFREMAAQLASQVGKLGFKGADIASATTTNLANATGWYLDITGTTTITGFGTVDAGQMFMLRFTGALTLTHNSTSLILPGSANIATAAGDVAFMMSLGSGNWRCLAYTRASGGASFTTIAASSNITLSNSSANILQATSDGADTGQINLCGGGSASTVRGGVVLLYGNEHATHAGKVRLVAGDTGSVSIEGTIVLEGFTASDSGVPVTVNSTNSNAAKIALHDNGTVRGYVGASSSNALIVSDSSAATQMTLSQAGDLVVQGSVSAANGRFAHTDGLLLRPNGPSSSTGQVVISTAGAVTVNGTLDVTGAATANGNTLAQVYTGSTRDETSFPIGTTLLVNTSTNVDRNAAATIYIDAAATSRYALTGTTALSGTWRARGDSGDAMLFERVA